MNHYADADKCTSIHLSPEMEWYNITVDDKSIKVGGTQDLTTLDGIVIPLNMQDGLPYLDVHPYTDHEWEDLPHVHLTYEDDWDPSMLDHDQSDDQDWYDQYSSMPLVFPLFDEQGNICHYLEAHVSQIAQLHGKPMTVEDDDDLYVSEDARDDMVPLDDELTDDVNDSADQCIYQANFHHLICHTDTNP